MLKDVNRKYILVLASASALVLAAGAWLRPTPGLRPPAQPTEAVPLQRLSNTGDLRRFSEYFANRVSGLEAHMVYLPEFQATGLAWDGQGLFLTTLVQNQSSANIAAASADLAYALVRKPQHKQLRPVLRMPNASLAPEGWVVLVARRPDGQLIWRAAMAGGVAPATCAESAYHEVVFTAPLDAAFAGGGLFDLDGMLLGMVSRCGDRFVAISTDDIETGLRSGETLTGKLVREYGLKLAALAPETKSYFKAEHGLLVSEVHNVSLAAASGIEPGDILEAFGGRAIESIDDLALLGIGIFPAEPALTIVRGGRRETVLLAPRTAPFRADSSPGILLEAQASGLRIENVEKGSRAFQAGLRAGDRILRIGPVRDPDARAFARAFSAAPDLPVFVVFEREGVQRGALLKGARPGGFASGSEKR